VVICLERGVDLHNAHLADATDAILGLYDTKCYFNVRSKADISRLNLPHGNRQLKKCKTEKLKSKNTDMLRSKVNSLGNPYSET